MIKITIKQGYAISRKLRLPHYLQNLQGAADNIFTLSKRFVQSVRWPVAVSDAARLAVNAFGNFLGQSPGCVCIQARSPPPLTPTLSNQVKNVSNEFLINIYSLWHTSLIMGQNFFSIVIRCRASISSIASWLQGPPQQTPAANLVGGMVLTMYKQLAKHLSLAKLFWMYALEGIRFLAPGHL
jgi:hypothetical protein